MKFYIYLFSIFFSLNIFSEFDTKCSILLTKRLQTSEDAYKDAIGRFLGEEIPQKYIKKEKKNFFKKLLRRAG